MEGVFMTLMKNLGYYSTRAKSANLRKLLTKYYPQEMSEEWFEKRKKQKKSLLRVSFCIDEN